VDPKALDLFQNFFYN